MAKPRPKIKYDFTVTIELSPDEACALGAIAGYDEKAFIEVFKKHMGTHYIRDYESCVPELFKSLRGLDDKVKEYQKKLSQLEF